MSTSKKKKYNTWTAQELEQAMGAMDSGDMGLNCAARTYGIPMIFFLLSCLFTK
jgi:exonuclease VII small subunit